LHAAAKEAQRLHHYEPENNLWRREFLFHQFARLEDCYSNYPEEISVDEINVFINKVELPENKMFYTEFENRIKKLRAKDPEPLD